MFHVQICAREHRHYMLVVQLISRTFLSYLCYLKLKVSIAIAIQGAGGAMEAIAPLPPSSPNGFARVRNQNSDVADVCIEMQLHMEKMIKKFVVSFFMCNCN